MYKKVITLFYLLVTISFFSCKKNTVNKKDRVTIAYQFFDQDSVVFDKSIIHGNFDKITDRDVISFEVNNGEVIRGLDSLIVGCQLNKLYTFYIPSSMAYKEEEIYFDLPSNSNIYVRFKIIKIE